MHPVKGVSLPIPKIPTIPSMGRMTIGHIIPYTIPYFYHGTCGTSGTLSGKRAAWGCCPWHCCCTSQSSCRLRSLFCALLRLQVLWLEGFFHGCLPAHDDPAETVGFELRGKNKTHHAGISEAMYFFLDPTCKVAFSSVQLRRYKCLNCWSWGDLFAQQL